MAQDSTLLIQGGKTYNPLTWTKNSKRPPPKKKRKYKKQIFASISEKKLENTSAFSPSTKLLKNFRSHSTGVEEAI